MFIICVFGCLFTSVRVCISDCAYIRQFLGFSVRTREVGWLNK